MSIVSESAPKESIQSEPDPHAYNRLLYAEDAKHCDKPWEWWECGSNGIWSYCGYEPEWNSGRQYRRKADAPPRWVPFKMDLRDYSEGQKEEIKQYLYGKNYAITYPFEDPDFIWTDAGVVYQSKCSLLCPDFAPLRTPADLGIVLEPVDKQSLTTDPHADLQQQWELDAHCVGEEEAVKFWEYHSHEGFGWIPSTRPLRNLDKGWIYRRKPDAPDWSQEIGLAEVQNCPEWPKGFDIEGTTKVIAFSYLDSLSGYDRRWWRVWEDGRGWTVQNGTAPVDKVLDHLKQFRPGGSRHSQARRLTKPNPGCEDDLAAAQEGIQELAKEKKKLQGIVNGYNQLALYTFNEKIPGMKKEMARLGTLVSQLEGRLKIEQSKCEVLHRANRDKDHIISVRQATIKNLQQCLDNKEIAK